MWISLTAADVRSRLSAGELSAIQSIHQDSGDTDLLTKVTTQVVDEVRGYIAAWPENTLEEGTKIPSKLSGAALAMIRYRIITSLPSRTLMTQERSDEYKDAIRLIERVSEGKFRIEEPVTAEDESVRYPKPSITGKTRSYDRASSQDGI